MGEEGTPNCFFQLKLKTTHPRTHEMKTRHMFFLEHFAPCAVALDSFVWPARPAVFPIADDGSSSFPVTRAKPLGVLPQEILLALPSLGIQNPASPHHCHRCPPAPGSHHLSAGLLWTPPICSPSFCLHLAWQPERACDNTRQTTPHLCSWQKQKFCVL